MVTSLPVQSFSVIVPGFGLVKMKVIRIAEDKVMIMRNKRKGKRFRVRRYETGSFISNRCLFCALKNIRCVFFSEPRPCDIFLPSHVYYESD
jgi:hypothetical protein